MHLYFYVPDLYKFQVKYTHIHDPQIHVQIKQYLGDAMLYEFLFQKSTN